jgi:AraC family cel operon transcriptional repressor
MPPRLRLRDFIPPGASYHLASPATITPTSPRLAHTHDFYEVFYVDGGSGWHLIEGEQRRLLPGMLTLVRESDVHAFSAEGHELRLANLAFAKGDWTSLFRRYFADHLDPMQLDARERTRMLNAHDHQHLRRSISRMARATRDHALLDHYLIDVMWMWLRSADSKVESGMAPGWLLSAVEHLRRPDQLRYGTAALAELAGRSPEHVARAAKRWLGKTPTELLNEARMEHAGHLMVTTGLDILDVANDCGLPNLGHFYRLFGARYGFTPRQYRLRHHQILGGSARP